MRSHSSPLVAVVIGCGSLLLGSSCPAGEGWHWPQYPAAFPPCRMKQAGYPNTVAIWARNTYDTRYSGYYVGGSSPCKGGARCFHEGTWGVDYDPWWSRVALRWRHEHGHERYGHYEPDHKNCPINACPEGEE